MSRHIEWKKSYTITDVGPKCPLVKGEIVTGGQRWETELMTGYLIAQEVIREDGQRVMLRPDQGSGAILRLIDPEDSE